MSNLDMDNVAVFIDSIKEDNDMYVVKVSVIKDGNSYQAHGVFCSLEGAENRAVKRALELAFGRKIKI